MKRLLSVLALLAGLGSFISCKHPVSNVTPKPASSSVNKPAILPKRMGKPSNKLNPFDRYLADTKANWPEPALVRFANMCQIDVDTFTPKYAQQPGEKWILVKDLSHAQEDQETDFYHTVAVWHTQNRILAEIWGMELDTGDYFRLFYCLENNKITLVDSVSWSISPEDNNSKNEGWGFEHSWKLASNGIFETIVRRFIDLREMPIAAPKLDAETQKGLDEEDVGTHYWADLKLPDGLLR
ncbi:MAG TPA: hypothetical protein VGF01_02225 [Terracidiphilus sp.]